MLSDVAAGYGNDIAVEHLSAELHPGDAVAVIGPNGAGKTTLMRAVLGLVPLATGAIKVLGKLPDGARSDVAYVQQATTLDPEFPVSVFDVVLMGRYRKVGWLRRPGRVDRRIALAALEEVGMSNRSGDRFGLLSGGQRQRVLLGRAIAQESPLLLLDEPFNGVDATTVDVCLEVLQRMRERGVAILMSTHDIEVARRSCNKVLLMNRRQYSFGLIEETLTPKLLGETFGGKSLTWGDGDHIVTTG